MVVLVVTWMAKMGRETEVAALFSKLTDESRKEPGCLMYQVHRHKTEARRFLIYEQYKDDAALEATAPRLTFCNLPGRICPRLLTASKGSCMKRWGSPAYFGLSAISTPADA